MRQFGLGLLAICGLLSLVSIVSYLGEKTAAQTKAASLSDLSAKLRATRSSPSDLEISGDLTGLPPKTTRYITREDLLTLPQVTYTVTDDANFKGPTKITGVELEELIRRFTQKPEAEMVTAVCDDLYEAHYPQDYISAHHPLLVLEINDQSPSGWPKSSDGSGSSMGPYLISHPHFTPAFKILSHKDEPQIPWGVVRLEFRNEKAVFGAIAPHGPLAADSAIQAGYRIAQQNCFRCHNLGDEGGTKAQRPWEVLSAWASSSPTNFAAYIRNPQAKNPKAQMPGNLAYDDATLKALTAYFQTFSEKEKR
jgi:mono/diheme cytochrome c family protein